MTEQEQDRRPRSRRAAMAASVALLALSVGMTVASATTSAPPSGSGHSHAGTPTPPGEDPNVQQWFKNRESMVIELNNALQAARGLTTKSGPTTAACVRLSSATWPFRFNARSPEAKLDAFASAGRTQFTEAAGACLAGDFTTMRRLIDEGAALRADAQAHLDEMLHGEE
ncbi:MAG: hypothetical protein ABIQ18_26310 [Umezawaea sp.]